MKYVVVFEVLHNYTSIFVIFCLAVFHGIWYAPCRDKIDVKDKL